MPKPTVDHYDAPAVFRGLIQGADARNRVAQACLYRCPRCRHQIRFRWRSFHRADASSAFQRRLRRVFDDLTPRLDGDEQRRIDYFCPKCAAPTRIIFRARAMKGVAHRFEIYAALVGMGKATA